MHTLRDYGSSPCDVGVDVGVQAEDQLGCNPADAVPPHRWAAMNPRRERIGFFRGDAQRALDARMAGSASSQGFHKDAAGWIDGDEDFTAMGEAALAGPSGMPSSALADIASAAGIDGYAHDNAQMPRQAAGSSSTTGPTTVSEMIDQAPGIAAMLAQNALVGTPATPQGASSDPTEAQSFQMAAALSLLLDPAVSSTPQDLRARRCAELAMEGLVKSQNERALALVRAEGATFPNIKAPRTTNGGSAMASDNQFATTTGEAQQQEGKQGRRKQHSRQQKDQRSQHSLSSSASDSSKNATAGSSPVSAPILPIVPGKLGAHDFSKRVELPAAFSPKPTTVLIGRGKHIAKAEGNINLERIVDDHLGLYSTSESRIAKSAIVTNIIHLVRHANDYEGCFVRRIPKGDSLCYCEVVDTEAREKIGSIFRNKMSERYRSSTKSRVARRRLNRNMTLSARQYQNAPEPERTAGDGYPDKARRSGHAADTYAYAYAHANVKSDDSEEDAKEVGGRAGGN